MPFKLNQERRRRIPRQKHKVINSAAYDAALRQRGSLTVWFTDEAIAGWRAPSAALPRAMRAEPSAAPPWYSPLAILTALTLRAVFRLALRQAEGLIGSIIGLLGLELPVPDHSTLSRRATTLAVPRPQLRCGDEPMHLLVDSTGLRLCGAGEAGQGSARVASGIPAEGPPVGVETMVRKRGITLRKGDLGEISGLLVRDGTDATIGVNAKQHRVRQRFTIAHEFGHFVLHESIAEHVDQSYRIVPRDIPGEVRVHLRSEVSSQGKRSGGATFLWVG